VLKEGNKESFSASWNFYCILPTCLEVDLVMGNMEEKKSTLPYQKYLTQIIGNIFVKTGNAIWMSPPTYLVG
jgi:hypothetical protein